MKTIIALLTLLTPVSQVLAEDAKDPYAIKGDVTLAIQNTDQITTQTEVHIANIKLIKDFDPKQSLLVKLDYKRIKVDVPASSFVSDNLTTNYSAVYSYLFSDMFGGLAYAELARNEAVFQDSRKLGLGLLAILFPKDKIKSLNFTLVPGTEKIEDLTNATPSDSRTILFAKVQASYLFMDWGIMLNVSGERYQPIGTNDTDPAILKDRSTKTNITIGWKTPVKSLTAQLKLDEECHTQVVGSTGEQCTSTETIGLKYSF